MKLLRLLILALTAGIVFTSCQKELSAETGSAIGTLAKDAAGDCSPIGVNGAYKQDTALNATNFVDIQLDVTNVGIYIISTDTVNGYYFRATGVTPLPGANSIRLIGFGKPIAVGTDVFTVKFGGTVCEFNVNVTLGTGGGGGTTAVFTFPNGTPCAGATQTPNFFVGVPTNPAINTMTLLVNVTQAGTYNFATTSAGGLIFSGTGSLAVGNNQPIVLGASGTPAGPTAGTINYTFSTTAPVASSCGFDLTVQAAPTPATYTINCATAATQTGTFQAGTALTLANKITLSVSPATLGSYTITTNAVNGVSYVGAGIFTTTFTQNVDLFANPLNNTPTAAGSFNYTTTGGTAPCTNVSVTYTAGGGGGGDFLRAKINGSSTFTNFTLSLNADLTTSPSSLEISGEATTGETFLLGLDRLTPITTNVLYNINDFLTGTVITVDYEDPTLVLYNTTPINIVTADPFKITITLITATRIEGTFSGSVEEDMPAGPTALTKKFTEGSFSLPLP